MQTAAILLTLWAQGSNQTAALPNPYGPGVHRTAPARVVAQPRVARTRLGRGGGFYGGHAVQEVIVEAPPPKEDPLKDLVISPVYQRDKITPKMIEIP